jgi:hypothetical protein
MTIVDKITASIKGALGDGFPVYYHDEPTLNVMTSTMEFPCALFQLLTNGRVVREAGQAKEVVTAAVFFVERSEFDFDAVQNEQVIDRCKKRAFAWLGSVNGGGLVDILAVNRTTRVYDRYDDILTGFGLSVDIKEQVGECEYHEEVGDFNDDFNDDFLI